MRGEDLDLDVVKQCEKRGEEDTGCSAKIVLSSIFGVCRSF